MPGKTVAGIYKIVTVYSGTANFATATDSSQVETISKALPVVTWANPAATYAGTALTATQLDASASVAGTYVYNPAVGTVLSAGSNQTLMVTFTPTRLGRLRHHDRHRDHQRPARHRDRDQGDRHHGAVLARDATDHPYGRRHR